jgi:deoxyguanosine kinase
LAVYESLHAALAEKVTLPDLIVFLRARTEALLERIAFRDRTYERDMDRDYIDAVNRAYDEFFGSYQAVPVLPLDTNEVNYVRHKNDLDYVIGRIRAALEGIYQPPLLEVG